jgi:hypothetical protein
VALAIWAVLAGPLMPRGPRFGHVDWLDNVADLLGARVRCSGGMEVDRMAMG